MDGLDEVSVKGLPREERLIRLLSVSDRTVDALAAAAALPVQQVLAALSELEVEGLVRAKTGSRFGLVRSGTITRQGELEGGD